jgi:hypothetical protein
MPTGRPTGLNLAFKVSAIARQSAPTDQTRGSESILAIKKPYFLRCSDLFCWQKLVFSSLISPQPDYGWHRTAMMVVLQALIHVSC